MSDTWTAIGSLGTLIGVVVGLASLDRGRRRGVEDEAARIRALLENYASRLSETVRLLLDGSALIDPSWRAADILVRRAGPEPTPDRVRLLMSEPDVRLGIGLQAWVSSPVAAELRESFRELAVAVRALTGQLTFLSPTAKIIESLVGSQDFPPLLLERLLDPSQGAELVEDRVDLPQPEALSLQVGLSLQGRGSTYFAARYADALKSLESVVELGVRVVSRLDARTLTRLARLNGSPQAEVTRTHTEEITARLLEISSVFSPTEAVQMQELVARVTTLLKKDTAADRIRQLGGIG
jgi:hypothetical protein